MENTIPIAISDIAILEKTLIDLINTFPELPEQVVTDGIFFQNLKSRNISMGLATIPSNSIITKTWIGGDYFAKYTFKIMLQRMSRTNEERIASLDILGKIGAWLEKNPIEKSNGEIYKLENYPPLVANRQIHQIEIKTLPRLVERLPQQNEIAEAIFECIYFVRKSLF